MTEYHLKLWSPRGNGNLSRVYVTAEDGSSLGYFEERINERARGTDSYYDRHRIAKGDTVEETGCTYACTLDAEIAEKIYSAPEIKAHMEAAKLVDDWQKFASLTNFARGRAAILIETKAQKKAQLEREKFTIEL